MSRQVSGCSMALPQAWPECPMSGGTGFKMREGKGCEVPLAPRGSRWGLTWPCSPRLFPVSPEYWLSLVKDSELLCWSWVLGAHLSSLEGTSSLHLDCFSLNVALWPTEGRS